MTVCRDTSELYIYYIVPSNYDRIDMKPQKISSSPVSYCTETCAHINSCRKKKKKKRQIEMCILLHHGTDFIWLPPNLLK